MKKEKNYNKLLNNVGFNNKEENNNNKECVSLNYKNNERK
jgi:hypothetical protein